MMNLGTRAGIPVFAARYKQDFSKWLIVPLNGIARDKLPKRKVMPERQWITFLYELRGYTPPSQLFEDLKIEI